MPPPFGPTEIPILEDLSSPGVNVYSIPNLGSFIFLSPKPYLLKGSSLFLLPKPDPILEGKIKIGKILQTL